MVDGLILGVTVLNSGWTLTIVNVTGTKWFYQAVLESSLWWASCRDEQWRTRSTVWSWACNRLPIQETCPVRQNWDFSIMYSMLVTLAFLRTYKIVSPVNVEDASVLEKTSNPGNVVTTSFFHSKTRITNMQIHYGFTNNSVRVAIAIITLSRNEKNSRKFQVCSKQKSTVPKSNFP